MGSLREGKDADLCVLNGDPLAPATSVLATWVDGEVVWKAHDDEHATVIEVGELHVGDGRILRPGQLLMQGGRIRDVGERVSHPRGATVVRGRTCMPGMIDAFGHLGLEGSRKVPATDYALGAIAEPGDEVDRRVALEGITTVVLTPRSGDRGRDVIATLPGIGSIRYFDQVKAYAPGNLVKAEEVQAMLGVLSSQGNVSKGIVTTTSNFAPGIFEDESITRLMPYRLELKPRAVLLEWLATIAAKPKKV